MSEGMEYLIECIMRDKADYINRQIFSKKWQKDEKLYHSFEKRGFTNQSIVTSCKVNGFMNFNL
jgi:hypothetical protein